MAIKQYRLKRFGPPGTGKTTTTLRDIEAALADGIPPQAIGYLTFTRNAAEEGRARMQAKFGFGDSDMPYARTIHSLCYRWLGLKPERVVPSVRLREWGEQQGWEFAQTSYAEDYGAGEVKLGDWLLGCYDYARNKMTRDLARVIRECGIHPDLAGDPVVELEEFIRRYERFKAANDWVDFADMLTRALRGGITIPVVNLYVDEAQDLSPLQHAVIDSLQRACATVTLAGDDDQAIMLFQGAEPELLLNWPATEVEVLSKSWRLSRQVHRLAQAIITQNRRRQAKVFTCRDEDGSLNYAEDLRDLPLDEDDGSWMILARNRRFLWPLAQDLMEQGVPFVNRRGFSPLEKPKVVAAAAALDALAKGEEITLGELAAIYEEVPSRIPAGPLVEHGAKARLADRLKVAGEEHRAVRLGSPLLALTPLGERLLRRDALGLLKINRDWQAYLAAVIRKHGRKALTEPPRVILSTIHGVKGEEADHVCILSAMSAKTAESYLTDPEEERRVFYVGVTRARRTVWQMDYADVSTAAAFDWPLVGQENHDAAAD